MDLATLIGMLGAFAVIAYAVILQDQLAMFTDDLFSPMFVLTGTMLGVRFASRSGTPSAPSKSLLRHLLIQMKIRKH